MADAMCSNSNIGSCSIVKWTPFSIAGASTGTKANFTTNLPVACGSQCNADANSPCATSCTTCDGVEVAGADTPVTRRYKMGTMAAQNIMFSYNTLTIKDRVQVIYEGGTIFDSDCVGTEGYKYANLSYSGNSVEVRVDVEPNCEGTTGTQWYFTLPCTNCKGCQEYQCLDDSKAHCGPNGYLTNYGLYFCNRYYEYYNDFDDQGKAFIDCVRPRLLDYVENYLSRTTGKPDCNDLYKKAFDSHPQIYAECNFCNVFFSNWSAFVEVIYKSLLSTDAWKQIGIMVGKCGTTYYNELCDKYPSIPLIC